MHDRLPDTLSKCTVELVAVVLTQVIPHKWLATILVDSLQNLVPRSITKARKKRQELAANSCGCIVLKDNSLKLWEVADFGMVTHEPLRDSVDLRRCEVSTRTSMPIKNVNIRDEKQQAPQFPQILKA